MISFVGMLVEGVAWVDWTRAGLTTMVALLAVGICGARTLKRYMGRESADRAGGAERLRWRSSSVGGES
jgi:hypothetical protein